MDFSWNLLRFLGITLEMGGTCTFGVPSTSGLRLIRAAKALAA
jgi:hypothetical protein